MKKIILSCLFLCLFPFKNMAQVPEPSVFPGIQIHFVVLYYGGPTDPLGGNMPIPRSPLEAPNVSIDGFTLYTGEVPFDTVLQIADEDGVVYTTFIPAGTISIELPTTLSGNYELRLIWNEWCFSGNVMF